MIKPGVPLLVCGCLAGIDGSRDIDAVQGVPINLMANDNYIDELIGARVPLNSVDDANSIDPTVSGTNPINKGNTNLQVISSSRKHLSRFVKHALFGDQQACSTSHYEKLYYIRIAVGCLEECSYCAIRFESGTLRSKPLESVVRQMKKGLDTGHKTFYLLGEDVGAYGQDLGSSIVNLLRALLSCEGEYQLVLSDFHPRWFIQYYPELSEIFVANVSRIGHIEIPVQSGSDKILNLMKRHYSSEDIKRCGKSLREKAPDIHMKTHLIIGFPGETDDDFDQTLDLVRTVKFDRVISYQYTDRPGTEASGFPGKVSSLVKIRRHWRCCREFR
jgi:MiaB/RimO family radical SAM methylthiotransferase